MNYTYEEFIRIGKELTRLTSAATSLEEWRTVIKQFIAKYGDVFVNFADCSLYESENCQCTANIRAYTDEYGNVSGKSIVITSFVPCPDAPYGRGDSIEILTILL